MGISPGGATFPIGNVAWRSPRYSAPRVAVDPQRRADPGKQVDQRRDGKTKQYGRVEHPAPSVGSEGADVHGGTRGERAERRGLDVTVD